MKISFVNALFVLVVATLLVQGTLIFLFSSKGAEEISVSSLEAIDQFDFSEATEEPQKEEAVLETFIPKEGSIFQEYKVKAGDTLTSIWSKLEGPTGGDYKIVQAMKEAGMSVRSLKAGEILQYVKDHVGEIVEIRKSIDYVKTLILRGDSKAGYQSIIDNPKVITSNRTVIGAISSSFFETATAQEVPYDIIDNYVDLFSGRVEFRRDLHPGDEFVVIYQERRLEDGRLVNPGEIIAASLKSGGEMMAAIMYEGTDKEVRYFDENGESLANAFLRYPLQFTRISSVFSSSRFHPVLKRSRAHNGVDFAAPTGTPVRSVADGVVILAGWSGGGGKTVKIQHGPKYATAYLHLSAIMPKLKRGTKVKRGEIIGRVGSTGLATGPHLHYSFYDRGRYVDPLKIKLPRLEDGPGAKIPKEVVADYVAKLRLAHESAKNVDSDRTPSV